MTTNEISKEMSELFDEFERIISSEDHQKRQKQFKKELSAIEEYISELRFKEYLMLAEKEFSKSFCIDKFNYIKGAYCSYVTFFENIEFDDLNDLMTLNTEHFYNRSNNSSSEANHKTNAKEFEIMASIANKVHKRLYELVIEQGTTE